RLEAAQERLGESETTGAAVAARVADIERSRARIQREVTAAKVELAKSEERLTTRGTHRDHSEKDRQGRRRSLAECREQLVQSRRRAARAQASILDAESR